MRILLTILVALVLAAPSRAEWIEYSPAGSIDGRGILQEVLSRCTEQGRSSTRSADPAEWCHEATHQLNARIRISLRRPRINAFYVGGNRAMVLVEPRVTLQRVAQYVSPQLRNGEFQVYFVEAIPYWNDQPLFVLDEFTAYCNGSQAAHELGCDPHGSHERCIWFCHFSDCLVRAVKEHDPTYPQLAELIEFVEWQKLRAQALAGKKNSLAGAR